ncbi:MAG TPA: nicotinate phosphoribosyltransferase [Chloroflexota bacterium]|nr:nicotinate phosphoribosyltransferase [Chloroflexota bacterium]
MSEPAFDLPDAVLNGGTADFYFHRTLEILRAEGLNPTVTMEVFGQRDGLMCGVLETTELLRQAGFEGELWAVPEGQPFHAKETSMRLIGRYQSCGLYETAYLGILASCCGWATAAQECVAAAEGIPIIGFGARHIHPRVAALMDYASIVAGFVTVSTPAGAALRGLEASGTMPHALILIVGDTVEAARAFDKHIDPRVMRTVLVDTFHDEVEEALRVADALDGRLWGIRLDTPYERGGVTPDLVIEMRARLDAAGHHNVRIFVSGGVDPAKIRLFRERGCRIDGYGVGSYVSGARPVDFTSDIREIEGRPVAKRGRLPGRQENPRLERML